MPRSTRSSDAPKEILGRLHFNTPAARQLFPETAKGVRLRIDRGGLILHATNSKRGVDVIAIARRPREVSADIEAGTLSRQVMRRLYKAGLTEAQPYFVLEPVEPASRGWYGLEHVPDQQAPKRQPVMAVSGFDPPPTPIDMTHWRRFLKAVTTDKPVDPEEWETTRRMILTAERITSRRGRHSQQRELAGRLLEAVERHAVELLTWAKRQPEYGEDVISLLDQLDVQQIEDGAKPTPEPADETDEAAAAELLAAEEETEGEAVAAAEEDEGGEADVPQETQPEAEMDEAATGEPEQPVEASIPSRLEGGPEVLEEEKFFETELDPDDSEPLEEGVEQESTGEQEPEGEPAEADPADTEPDDETESAPHREHP